MNRLTGTLPPELGSLSSLRVLFCYKNKIAGSLPEEFGQLTNLEDLIIHTNRFTNTIPFSIGSNLKKMRVLFFQGNFFSGPLDTNFFKDSKLETIDITNNELTGTLPAGLFEAPHLQTLALSINCFTGSLPDSICSARKAVVLALDGLGAATACPGTIVFPVTNIKLFNTLEGIIPECVWTLPNLTLLHVAGVCTLRKYITTITTIIICTNISIIIISDVLLFISNGKFAYFFNNIQNGLTGTLPQIPPSTQLRNLSIGK
jgi:hypothetical protein